MIAAQVAMAIVLVFGAVIAGRAFVSVLRIPLGFSPDDLVVINARPDGNKIPELRDFYHSFDEFAVTEADRKAFRELVEGLDPHEREILKADVGIYVCDFDHRYEDTHVPIRKQGIVKSPVRIGSNCWFGEKTTVLRGVTVGDGCVIASHALVNRDVPPNSVVGGVPARVLKTRGRDAQRG